MGIGGALYEAVDFQGGRVLNSGFTRYRVPRITDMPEIDVTFCGDDDEPSTGAGEPGIVPTAPALSNAVFAATGVRHRELPNPASPRLAGGVQLPPLLESPATVRNR